MTQIEMRGVSAAKSNWPLMARLPDGAGILLHGSYVPPSLWWQQGMPALLVLVLVFGLPGSCTLMGTAFYGRWNNMPATVALIYSIAFVLALFVLPPILARRAMKRNLNILLLPDAIVFNGIRHPRRTAQYAREPHARAKSEQIAAEEAREDRDRVQRVARVFRDAWQVTMRYEDRRIVLADFGPRDIEMARSLVWRLQEMDSKNGLERELGLAAPRSAGPPAHDEFGADDEIR